MSEKYFVSSDGLKHYRIVVHGTIVWIDETSDGLWGVMTLAPFGGIGIFASLPEAYAAAEEECYQIEREAQERRSRFPSVASDDCEF